MASSLSEMPALTMGYSPYRILEILRLLIVMKKNQQSGVPASEELRTTSENQSKGSPRDVAERAYFYYLNDGSTSGRELEHWLRAEQDLILGQQRTTFHGSHN